MLMIAAVIVNLRLKVRMPYLLWLVWAWRGWRRVGASWAGSGEFQMHRRTDPEW